MIQWGILECDQNPSVFWGFRFFLSTGSTHTQDFLLRDAALSCSTQSLYIILLCSLVYSRKCIINGWGWDHQYLDLIHKHTGLHVHMWPWSRVGHIHIFLWMVMNPLSELDVYTHYDWIVWIPIIFCMTKNHSFNVSGVIYI